MKRYILSTLAAAAALCSCQDDWNEHYDQQADSQYGTASIYEIIASRPELSDFKAVLDSARLFANSRMSATHYSELLARDQFLTVWAPVNGTFDRDSLLRMCQTSHGDSLVELHFLKNHIARYGQSAVGLERGILTLNRKTVGQSATTFGDARIREANIASRNGVLHVLETPATYRYNIYEALYSLPEFNHVGRFLQSYQIDEFDETQSLAMGVVDGKVVYVDSVFYSWNKLLDYTYGHLDREDSTYWMLVPDRDLWNDLYADAERYFRYPQGTLKADSIHDYWANYALLQDLVYNPHAQTSLRDSLCSTTWYKVPEGDQYHVYHNPWTDGGLMSYVYDSLACSNGSIYRLHEWPFSKNHTYHKKIVVQAEGRIYKFFEAEGKTLTVKRIYTQADSVSGGGYIALTPTTNYSGYYVQYEVPGVLSGTYDVCAVILPKSVRYKDEKEGGKDMYFTNKFVAEISYVGADGKTYDLDQKGRYKLDTDSPSNYVQAESKNTDVPFLFNCNYNSSNQSLRAFTNDAYRVDTVHLATVKFPACNYDQQKVTTLVTIKNSLTSKQAKDYSSSIYLDCILFLPREDE